MIYFYFCIYTQKILLLLCDKNGNKATVYYKADKQESMTNNFILIENRHLEMFKWGYMVTWEE